MTLEFHHLLFSWCFFFSIFSDTEKREACDVLYHANFCSFYVFPGIIEGYQKKFDRNSSFPPKNSTYIRDAPVQDDSSIIIKTTNSSLSITSFWRYPTVLNFPKALSFCFDIIKIQVQFASRSRHIFHAPKNSGETWMVEISSLKKFGGRKKLHSCGSRTTCQTDVKEPSNG